jgi:aspartyl/asparaginyl beta-hydroxylase (cupin superfamily)
MFEDTAGFPFLKPLEENWRAVLDEYRAVAADPQMHAWPEGSIYEGRWDTFGLYAFGRKKHENCARCPITTRLVEAIPGMMMAGFSRLAPGTHIKPHVGYDGWAQYVLRCHLGLIVPDGCEMRVGPETRTWREGRTLLFCDATEHEVWNRSAEERVVLLLDFRNPKFKWKLLNPALSPELQEFIGERWPQLTFGEKAGYVLWRIMNLGRRRTTA